MALDNCSLVIAVMEPLCSEYWALLNVQFCVATERGDLVNVFLYFFFILSLELLLGLFPKAALHNAVTANAHAKTGSSIYAVI